MIPIDLIYNVPIGVYISSNPITVSRIGDVIVLPNETKENTIFEARYPWKYFVVGVRWNYLYGLYAQKNFRVGSSDNLLQIDCAEWDIKKIQKATQVQENLSVAFIQLNKNNDFQAAVCKESTLCGLETFDDEIQIAFNLTNCEMIYNR